MTLRMSYRDGLITKEAVEARVCSRRVDEGKDKCEVALWRISREKAPDSPWTTARR